MLIRGMLWRASFTTTKFQVFAIKGFERIDLARLYLTFGNT